MEDKNKNRISCAYQDFLKKLEDQIKEEDKDGNLLKTINEKLIKLNNNKEINFVIYKQDFFFTKNIVYLLGFDSTEEYSIVLKICKENNPLPFLEEINLLKKLEEKELIPKQYLKIFSNSFKYKISIEEFINKPHQPETDPYNKTLMELVITSTAEFNSIQVIENFQEQNNSINKICSFYFDHLFKKYAKSKKRFSEVKELFNQTINQSAINYFKENEEKLNMIEHFLNSVPEYYEEIMKNYSLNKEKIVFSYIDLHSTNYFKVEDKIKFFDFDDLSFCLPGFDLANYISETQYICFQGEYPFCIFNANKMTDDIVIIAFKKYFEILKKETNVLFADIGLDEIYRLFCLCLIKSASEYVIRIQDDIFEKKKIDFISLAVDRISNFDIFYNQISK